MAEGPQSGDARMAGGATVGAIRSGMSRPRDPDAPSLLTTLPAELRLQIYEHMFLRDIAIIVKPRPSWFGNERFIDPAEICSDEDSFQSSKKLSQTSSGIDSGFGLLESCRQIYTEAIATLYSKNTFTLSLTRSEFLTPRMNITVQWMLTLGSTISLLRHVHIRSIEKDYGKYNFPCPVDIVRLARFMWQNPTKELHISFGPHPNFLKDQSAAVSRCEYSERMDNVFAALVTNDTLGIKRYHISERLVSGIIIDDYVSSGRIYHPWAYIRGRYRHGNGGIDESDDENNEPTEFRPDGIFKKFDVSDKGRSIS